MAKIFDTRALSKFRDNKKIDNIIEKANRNIDISDTSKTTIFLSHKHSDIEDLIDVICLFETEFNVKVYIDSRDKSMPDKTSGETAKKIKKRIRKCDKFVLLATEGAIESKWCNWELGFGDAYKYSENIALFPIKPKNKSVDNYLGKEYLSIYPYITYRDGTETYSDREYILKGFYVKFDTVLTPLAKWLKNNGEKYE